MAKCDGDEGMVMVGAWRLEPPSSLLLLENLQYCSLQLSDIGIGVAYPLVHIVHSFVEVVVHIVHSFVHIVHSFVEA